MRDDALGSTRAILSVVTPTLRRPEEVAGLLESLTTQLYRPDEIILVDGAPPNEIATESLVATLAERLPFRCRYIRHGGGTAIQRNVGIDAARYYGSAERAIKLIIPSPCRRDGISAGIAILPARLRKLHRVKPKSHKSKPKIP